MILNIPSDFELVMQYNMPSFVVPKSLYPPGYHVDPSLPLPFLALGVQKHHIGIYHMGIYANEDLLHWFEENYATQVPTKLDIGKSCIRLKIRKISPLIYLPNFLRKCQHKSGSQLIKKKSHHSSDGMLF